LDKIGVNGFVLFNRLFQPDINVYKQENSFPLHLSQRSDNRLPLRYTGLLSGNIKGDICSSTGIYEGEDVVKMILAGAACIQIVSTLYNNGIGHIRNMLDYVQFWMECKGFSTLDEFRGTMNKINSKDRWVYARAQYVKLLMNPKLLIDNYPVP
jgi:dihydroorotate dehydrogenase (fumarate)